MRHPCLLAAAAALGAAAFLAPRDARALGPVDLEIAFKGGVGTNPVGGPINPLGVGLGGRAGVGLFGFYGGVSVIDYLGGSAGGVSEHSLMYGFEAGYNWKIPILTIRPQLGIGNYGLTVGSATNNSLYLEPGVTGLVTVGTFLIGADANLLVLPDVQTGPTTKSTDTAFTIHGQIGVRF